MSIGTAVTTDANTAVISAIRAHHAQLASQLRALTADVLTSARAGGDAGPARTALQDWYRTELVPHAVAEEHALYSEGAELERTRLLVDGMIAEHRSLVGLIGELGLARSAFDASTVAASALALFEVHLSKENDLLLPALDKAGIDLAAVLDGMHEILGGHDAHDHDAHDHGAEAASDGGCGCGSSHEHADSEAAGGPVAVQFGERPEPAAQSAPAAGTPDGGLDVRTLPHGQRHEIIFGRLDALAPGEELLIVNDHDPKPLRYQTSALWPDRFEWTYREAGPQVWRVAITRVG
jgi:uncharacterized protein (DUF2249 family)